MIGDTELSVERHFQGWVEHRTAKLWTVIFEGLPLSACWRHHGLREGFEVVFFTVDHNALTFDGATSALESSEGWVVSYVIELDGMWRTRRAQVRARTQSGTAKVTLESDGAGLWLVDGEARKELDGCMDVDLESSSLTNAFPVHRLGLEPGESADAPAAYVRASTLTVERLPQHYLRLGGSGNDPQFEYEAPTFDFRCRIAYDRFGLVVEYPGIASRAH